MGMQWTIDTVVGTGEAGYSGDGGPARAAALNNPFDLVFDATGNLIFSDTFNHCIRRVDARTGVISTIAGTGARGFDGDGGPATAARLNEPYGVAVASSGSVFVADRLNRRVRCVDGATGVITTLAGGEATLRDLVEPNGLAYDTVHQLLYVADVADHRVRLIDLKGRTLVTCAGTGLGEHTGDGGIAIAASLHGPRAVALAPDGSFYILERQGSTLRRVRQGVIETIAGTGVRGYDGDGGDARHASFNAPKEMAVGPDGSVLIVDTESHVIRRIDAATWVVTTIAGNGIAGGGGDGGLATAAGLARPHGATVGPDGAVYVGDSENHRIRKLTHAA
jgi:DNA-binding beta-propeller fold protein YncE